MHGREAGAVGMKTNRQRAFDALTAAWDAQDRNEAAVKRAAAKYLSACYDEHVRPNLKAGAGDWLATCADICHPVTK